MPRKKKTPTFAEKMLKRYSAGLSEQTPDIKRVVNLDDLPALDIRIAEVLNIVKRKHDKSRMLFFVMYDIESNKVRNQVVKYLIRKGCFRVQKSIFLADLEHAAYQGIKDDLAEVQACYENEDSILVVPISTDYLQAMRIIGKNINLDLVLKNKNTLFF
ncbi:MAG: CRISPR-associated endonuclease Cas2 [Candidatus Symbiothrix sp.]|jgi:CRISPR-associated protein Cas2|nr:CRISPR-associated endonuclease Cas2 [Candidatus Symbiothrix sp.]